MQSAPNLKEADPHDIFAIESVLAAHAHKAPPIAPDPERAAPAITPQLRTTGLQAHAAPPVEVASPVFVGPPAPLNEPTFEVANTRELPAEHVGPGEIRLDGLKPLGPQPTPKWAKRLFMAALGLTGAVAAAGWQHYGDTAKAMANEWVPPSVLAALSPASKTAVAEQPVAAAQQTAATDPATAPAEAAAPPAVITAAVPAGPGSASPESAQLQSMAQDLATMNQQVEELKATIAQLKASQAQMTRELAKASEAKVSEIKAPEPRMAAAPPPPARPVAPPPVRKPKPPAHTHSSSYTPSYAPSPAPVAAASAAPLPLVQPASPPPPAPLRQTLADDGQPVVRPPMPLR